MREVGEKLGSREIRINLKKYLRHFGGLKDVLMGLGMGGRFRRRPYVL